MNRSPHARRALTVAARRCLDLLNRQKATDLYRCTPLSDNEEPPESAVTVDIVTAEILPGRYKWKATDA